MPAAHSSQKLYGGLFYGRLLSLQIRYKSLHDNSMVLNVAITVSIAAITLVVFVIDVVCQCACHRLNNMFVRQERGHEGYSTAELVERWWIEEGKNLGDKITLFPEKRNRSSGIDVNIHMLVHAANETFDLTFKRCFSIVIVVAVNSGCHPVVYISMKQIM